MTDLVKQLTQRCNELEANLELLQKERELTEQRTEVYKKQVKQIFGVFAQLTLLDCRLILSLVISRWQQNYATLQRESAVILTQV